MTVAQRAHRAIADLPIRRRFLPILPPNVPAVNPFAQNEAVAGTTAFAAAVGAEDRVLADATLATTAAIAAPQGAIVDLQALSIY
jgi:hypothetical protein